MSHKFNHRGGGVVFRCDESGCGEVFDATAFDIKLAWEEATQFGWRMLTDHDPISCRSHLCPSHARIRMIT